MAPEMPPPSSPSDAPRRGQTHLSFEEVAAAAGISQATLARVVRIGLIEPDPPGGREFPAACVLRLRRMLRLRVDLGVNLMGAAIVIDLLERLDGLEMELARRQGERPWT